MAARQATTRRLLRRPPEWVRLYVPSWFLSLVVHATAIVLLMLSVHAVPRGLPGFGGFDASTLGAGGGEGGDLFDDEGGGGSSATVRLSPALAGGVDAGPQGASDGLFDDRPPLDALAALPKGGGGGLGPIADGVGGATGAGGFTSGSGSGRGSGGHGGGGGYGGRARTKLYGVEAEGYKFIYVFDRSGSMGGSGRNTPLSSAKAELLASLENLGETHQFQIIFYNEKPTMFALAGHPDRLVFGTSANRATAQHFVRGIVADGGTRHEDALWMALKLQPDVIFFLTDADQPQLSAAQLDKIQRQQRPLVDQYDRIWPGPAR